MSGSRERKYGSDHESDLQEHQAGLYTRPDGPPQTQRQREQETRQRDIDQNHRVTPAQVPAELPTDRQQRREREAQLQQLPQYLPAIPQPIAVAAPGRLQPFQPSLYQSCYPMTPSGTRVPMTPREQQERDQRCREPSLAAESAQMSKSRAGEARKGYPNEKPAYGRQEGVCSPENSPVPMQALPQPAGGAGDLPGPSGPSPQKRKKPPNPVHDEVAGEPLTTRTSEKKRRQRAEESDRPPATVEQKLLELVSARKAGLTSQQVENSRRELCAIIDQELGPRSEELKAAVERAAAVSSGLPVFSKQDHDDSSLEGGVSGEPPCKDGEERAPGCGNPTSEAGVEDDWDEMEDLTLEGTPDSCQNGKPELKSGSGVFSFLWGGSKKDSSE